MRVCTVPSSQPFLRTVVSALIEGRLIEGFDVRRDPGRLSDVTLYLPTSRACRLARTAFLEAIGADAIVLPRIVALGDIDEDELIFADAAAGIEALELPPKMGGMERHLLLASLISQWAVQLKPKAGEPPLVVAGPSALALAGDLARLIDDMITRQVDWAALGTLVPAEHDEYWQLTLEFLKIASVQWPLILNAGGKIEAADRRDRLIAAEAARLVRARRGPVIAAGSTGSMPATAEFLKTIAALPDGAVVLPGLDTDLDDEAWQAIDHDSDAGGAPSHPQFAMHALLQRFGISRADVRALAPQVDGGRDLMISEVMRPAVATGTWYQRLQDLFVGANRADALKNVSVIAAPNAEFEAAAIAVAMREAYAQGKTAALVTPDRALARRVMAALGRWNLPFEDSGGETLLQTRAGLFARLVADAVAEDMAPAPLLALLKHPLLHLGRNKATLNDIVAALEMAVLRGTRPPAGTAGLARALDAFRDELGRLRRREASLLHRRHPGANLDDATLNAASALVAALSQAFAPLERLSRQASLSDVARAYRDVVEALSIDDKGVVMAFEGRDGEALATAFSELLAETSTLTVSRADYSETFEALFSDRILRGRDSSHARLRILGTIEARLTDHDRVILGGLVEGVWPPEVRTDPWLNRPMRRALNLDLPERRMGLSAHDFTQLFCAPDVVLAYSAKVAGAPAVESRFLNRLEAVAGEDLWRAAMGRGATYLEWAQALDHPARVVPVEQPAPKPARALRPMQLSVTEIETWLRDPYSIYARHILKLHPLDPVDMPLGAADRGSAIHNAIGDFTTTFASALPTDSVGELRRFGTRYFAKLVDHPEAQALWWPRFLRIASWFAGWDRDRRPDLRELYGEISGRMSFAVGERRFMLIGRADRIEHHRDGSYALVDYKTGTVPTAKQVRAGLSPQLTLEAAMLRHGAFQGIPMGATVSDLVYVKLSGRTPAGEEQSLDLVDRDHPGLTPDVAADEARQKLENLIRRFDDESTPYNSLNLSMWSNRYGDYDNLARIKEWSAGRGEDDE
jgi:ATP-dependent helicase/nuclease subunit B